MIKPYRTIRDNKFIVVRRDEQLSSIVPKSVKVIKGLEVNILPYRPSSVKLLNNLGYDVLPAIRRNYDWAGITPFAHQMTTAAMMTSHRRGYVLDGMGTGKTLSSLFAIDYLIKIGEVRKVLVVCPLSTMNCVWMAQAFQWMPHLSVTVLHGSKAKRLELLQTDVDIYVINHDGVAVIDEEIKKRGDIDFVLVDELSAYRNSKTKRWKILKAITKNTKYLHGLTGTPIVKAPTDAFGLAKMVTPGNVTQYFKAFQNEVMRQVSTFTWLPRSDALDTVYDILQPATRATLQECSDIPDTVYETREVDMTSDQKKAYKSMKNDYYALHNGEEITAVNGGVRMGKLLQIAAGVVYNESGGVSVLPNPDRLQAIRDLIDGSVSKAIVFVPYRHQLADLYASLAKHYTVEQVHGGVTKNERDRIFGEFVRSPNPKVIVAVPSCMAHGLNLEIADTVIWGSPVTNLEIYLQANARIQRAGQNKKTIVAHVHCSPAEEKVYKVLETRGNMQAALLAMYETEMGI